MAALALGKLIRYLAAVALVLGIMAELVSLYRNTMEANTAKEVSRNSGTRQDAEARVASERAIIELETARNAARYQRALADKAEADARAAVAEAEAKTAIFEDTPGTSSGRR